jgi:hypothetical protein
MARKHVIVSDAVLNTVAELAGKRDGSRCNEEAPPRRAAHVETFEATNGTGRRDASRRSADWELAAARVRARGAERPG